MSVVCVTSINSGDGKTAFCAGFTLLSQKFGNQVDAVKPLNISGLTGPDGPTHHGMFDVAYLRVLPNMVVMAPGDADDLTNMLDFALSHDAPCSIRYPKTTADAVGGDRPAMELGRAEILELGLEGCIICFGSLLNSCAQAVEILSREGFDVGLINARFIKPLDRETILHAVRQCDFVVTVEESALMGGFGSAVIEAATDAGLDTSLITRLGIPDRFIEHGERNELLTDLGLDAEGIADACRKVAHRVGVVKHD